MYKVSFEWPKLPKGQQKGLGVTRYPYVEEIGGAVHGQDAPAG